MMMLQFSRKTVRVCKEKRKLQKHILKYILDALLGNLIQSFEETVQDDYLVIYTSSNAKV